MWQNKADWIQFLIFAMIIGATVIRAIIQAASARKGGPAGRRPGGGPDGLAPEVRQMLEEMRRRAGLEREASRPEAPRVEPPAAMAQRAEPSAVEMQRPARRATLERFDPARGREERPRSEAATPDGRKEARGRRPERTARPRVVAAEPLPAQAEPQAPRAVHEYLDDLARTEAAGKARTAARSRASQAARGVRFDRRGDAIVPIRGLSIGLREAVLASLILGPPVARARRRGPADRSRPDAPFGA